MGINYDLFRQRFEEVTKYESNKRIAEKLLWKESKVSKIKSGYQDMKVSELLQILEIYPCSADYLLGLSGVYESNIKYIDVLIRLYQMIKKGTIEFTDDGQIAIKDPLLEYLSESLNTLCKASALSEADLKTWIVGLMVSFNYNLLESHLSIMDSSANKAADIDTYKEYMHLVNKHITSGNDKRTAYIEAIKELNEYLEYLEQ